MTKKKKNSNKFYRRESIDLELFVNNNKRIKSILTPGEHGNEKNKNSDFGLILRTKQRIKRYYCIYEKQFKNIYKKIRKKFFFNIELINFLERRLDNIVYRMNFYLTRKNSKQNILHGNVYVNFLLVKSTSYIISPGDSIFVNKNFLYNNYLYNYFKKNQYNWLYVCYFNNFGIILSLPNNNYISINNNLIKEFYK